MVETQKIFYHGNMTSHLSSLLRGIHEEHHAQPRSLQHRVHTFILASQLKRKRKLNKTLSQCSFKTIMSFTYDIRQ